MESNICIRLQLYKQEENIINKILFDNKIEEIYKFQQIYNIQVLAGKRNEKKE